MLKLIAPGKRRNKHWLVRGTYEGNYIEKSLKVSLRKDAEAKLRNLIKQYDAVKKEKDNVTFSIASQKYIDFRNPSERTEKWLAKLSGYLGDMLVGEITQNDLVATANSFYPNGAPSSKNRAVIRPAAAVLHYAAENKWCDWLRIRAFREPEPKTRFLSRADELKLHATLRNEGTSQRVNKRLLLLWLFRQGDRISDVLALKHEDIDFKRMSVRRYISKSDRYAELPLDETIARYLKRLQPVTGHIFPWQTHHAVNKWCRKLSNDSGVLFTPHMARHTLGKRLNDAGVGLKTIMQTLGQSDTKSAIRYQTTDVENIRQAKKKMGIGWGKL